jgi:hypothetical protein
MKKTYGHAAMQYLHTHYPNGFPDMNFSLVSEEGMMSIISKLKSKNSSGYDGINNKLIKLSSQQISKPLTSTTSYPLHTLYLNKILKVMKTVTLLEEQLDNHLDCKGHINVTS